MAQGRLFPKDFVRSNLYNGVGRHVCQLQRLTFKFCKSANSSRGVRDFIENQLLEFSRENPGVVIYLQPRRWKDPFLVGEYLNQEEVKLYVNNLQDNEVGQWVEHLRSRNGQQIKRLAKYWHTDNPSVQGIWTPYTNKDTAINVTEFPDPQKGSFKTEDISSTEKLRKLYEELQAGNNVVMEPEEEEARHRRWMKTALKHVPK